MRPFSWSGANDSIRVIVQRGERMTENEVNQALRVSEQIQWWRALLQLIDDLRTEYYAASYQRPEVNNALGMAKDIGAHEALSGLMIELEKRRSSES